MFRFIHAADIHLDSPLRGLERYDGAPVDEIRGATRGALENLVELANECKADFVLVAGDVYDGDWKDHNTGLHFVRQMTKLRNAGIPVVLITGNHDAANKMTRTLRLPENVRQLSSRKAETFELEDLGVAVHGRGFAKAKEFDNLALDYPAAVPGAFNIGLLHTSLSGVEGHEPYAPCTLDQLRAKEYDYWALGHVHTRNVLCEDPPIVFPGNIQGRHIRETGPRGCFLVDVDDAGKATLTFHALDVFRWELCELDAAPCRSGEEVLERFATALQEAEQKSGDRPLAVRVLVQGRTQAHSDLLADPDRWIQEFRAVALDVAGSVWIEQIRFLTSARSDSSDSASTEGALGEILACVNEIRDDEALLRELAEELSVVRSKLPEELRDGLEDPAHIRGLLDEVTSFLGARLRAQDVER